MAKNTVAVADPVQVFNRVKNSVKNPKPDPIVLSNVNTPGEFVRQGDIYVTLLDGKPTGTLKKVPAAKLTSKEFQLAPGNSRGSRHMLDNVDAVEIYDRGTREDGIEAGYAIKVNEACSIVHPEHGTVNLGEDMWIAVTYQLTWDQVARRVQD